jgi:hypothetical protein
MAGIFGKAAPPRPLALICTTAELISCTMRASASLGEEGAREQSLVAGLRDLEEVAITSQLDGRT